jgi:hypothetical protein
MSTFPSLKTGAVLQYPATRDTRHSTCVLRFLDGSEQRFREHAGPLRRWVIRLSLLEESEMARLEEFFQSQQGRAGEFAFTDPWDGAAYPNCSLENDALRLDFEDLMRGRADIIIREDRY